MEAATVAPAPAPARSVHSFPGRSAGLGRVLLLPQPTARSAPGRRLVARRAAGDGQAVEAQEEALPVEKRFPPFPSVMDINQIREILPHRFPFLLVDRVIEYKAGEYAVGIKNVTINDNFFPGHFPERPIMPGVLMVEAMAQVGGLVMLQPEVGGSRDNFFFAGIDKVRFRKPVIAGDTLIMRMTLTKYQKRFGLAKMEGKAYVGGDLVCEGEFLLHAMDQKNLFYIDECKFVLECHSIEDMQVSLEGVNQLMLVYTDHYSDLHRILLFEMNFIADLMANHMNLQISGQL
ncbi:hypothetical protein GUJ93_ZPchr0010g8164 [Zizania palustris]|uniref:3-hydroxyacyl-[acyl-carrier-protein] dehydratase FabZ n=1 Tax=Zizania palustris TaxID=103762 RepID=A0A8J5R6U9_ZIZPA|nr:hypothetical protein GUJ93_ZPchr0034g18721 [Zizania palustris]KAG8086982.1 hypothetical protein GUJ93_ZPchr0010g8164 [Zizania palustris]